MATITKRATKGSPLTNNEVDANFENLNTDKQEILTEGEFVDGDKTKLDGIETGADVTDTTNVTAAGALMDSEVTNLAQVKAFDSADYATAAQGSTADSALQNVVEDTTPQLGGNLDLNSNDITGTGNINVTGTVTADENITIDTSSSGNGLTIQSSGNTYNRLTFDANRSASGNLLGEIMGEWDGTQVAAIRVSAGSDTVNKDDGQIYFLTNPDGTGNKNRANIANNGDIYFYDSAGSSQSFFWDASAESLGIGTSPDAPLTVQGGSGTAATIQLKGGALANDNASIHSLYNLYLKADSSESIANRNIIFQVGSTEAMRIDAGGKLLVGTQTVLHSSAVSAYLSGNNGVAARVTNNNFWNFVGANTSNVKTFLVYGDGDVENTNNSYGAISDSRFKSDIVDASSQIEDVMAMKVRRYTLDSTGATHIGVIAQELEESGMSGLVKENLDGTKSVRYSVLYMKAVKALQEAIAKIETLETTQADLLARIETLEGN